jgi:hypothetical protein
MNRSYLLLSVVFLLPTLAGCPVGEPEVAEGPPFGVCEYVNPFSGRDECKEYVGSSWNLENATSDCAAPVIGSEAGAFQADIACERPPDQFLGECRIAYGTVDANTTVFTGNPDTDCGGMSVGCGFAGGELATAEACGGDLSPGGGGTGGGEVAEPFRPFEQVCVDPLDGVPGQSPDGQVCTWESIAGATEEGRRYIDYASCESVYTQRPYWAAAVEAGTPDDDPRYESEKYMDNHEWFTSQVESTACVCCHSTEAAPEAGPSGWYIEASGLWIDTIDDDGLAMLAGWIDSTAFGAFHPEENNGFSRDVTGVPTSDPGRMKAFLETELSRRGYEEADFAEAPAFGGPLADQLAFVPDRCSAGAGVDEEGRVRWDGGVARYVYVLAPDSSPPGVPPNLDLPDGTVWRLDVSPDAPGVDSGVGYGEVPEGAAQAFPMASPPAELEAGRDYYLYVLRDIYQPLTRCVFEAS